MSDYRWEGSDLGADLEWTDEEPESRTAKWSRDDPPDGLVTLRFLWNAMCRQARLWFAIALIGLIGGALVPVVLPAPSLASTRLLLTHAKGDDPAEAMETDASLVTTRTVAQRVIDKLGLRLTPDKLLEHYSTDKLTDRVLEIDASATTDARATRLANTIANTFLQFRMEQINAEQEPIKKDIHRAKQKVEKLHSKIPLEQLLEDTDPSNDTGKLAKLDRAQTSLTELRGTADDMRIDASLMSNSRVLDTAAIVPHPYLKALVIDAITGLAGGLAIGLGLVVVSAVLSDRVRTRRDIARALGARVTLSTVGQRRRARRPLQALLGRKRLRDEDVWVAAHHLYTRVRWSEAKPTLAVIDIDSIEATVSITASLAATLAENGYRALLVDLTGVLATRLGATEPGAMEVSVGADGSTVVVYRPQTYMSAPEGPLLTWGGDDVLLTEWSDADLVLTLAAPSPALGSDHLRTWAADAGAVVTAGRSTATKIHSVAEMIRTAGLRLEPVIVLGADKTDETIGMVSVQDALPTYSESLEVIGQ